MGNELREYNLSGHLSREITISSIPEVRFHDVAVVSDRILISGYQSHPWLPKGYRPFGFLVSISIDDIRQPKKEGYPYKAEEADIIGFWEENNLVPAYLDEIVIQPLTNRIAIFSHNLKIIRLIEGDFEPLFVSSGVDSILYLAAFQKNTPVLYALTTDGELIFQSSVPSGTGIIVSPPLIANDKTVYWVGTHGIAAFDEHGTFLWLHKLSRRKNRPAYPLLFGDVLTVCFDSQCHAFDKDNKVIFTIKDIAGTVRTPLIGYGDHKYFVGTDSGIFEITQKNRAAK
jgi:hypothetical protein